jgi:transcription elongation GreA/GreB family factor
MARVLKLHPEVQDLVAGREVEEEFLIVSEESLETRKKAYDKLIKEEIPQNREDIKIARSYGDLRENFEYKSSKEYQRILMKRKADWERDLRLANPMDFTNPDTSAVAIGTTVELVPEEGGEPLTYSILGAWDGDPDKGIIAYLSERGSILLEKKVGEEVALPDPQGGNEHYKVKSIKVFSK